MKGIQSAIEKKSNGAKTRLSKKKIKKKLNAFANIPFNSLIVSEEKQTNKKTNDTNYCNLTVKKEQRSCP